MYACVSVKLMLCNYVAHSLEGVVLVLGSVDFGSHCVARIALEILAANRPPLLLGLVLRHLLVAFEAGHFLRSCACRARAIFSELMIRSFSCSELLGAMALYVP